MASSTMTAPPHSLILIADSSGGDVPVAMDGFLVVSTDSCIAVGCRSDADGDTLFILGDTREVDPGNRPVFHGQLKTPHRRIAIKSVIGQTILETPVPQQQTIVQIWVNDQHEPDEVIVGIG